MAGLKGKAGIVTGGSSGIGFQIANVLAQAGATVYVISRTGKPKEGVGKVHRVLSICRGTSAMQKL